MTHCGKTWGGRGPKNPTSSPSPRAPHRWRHRTSRCPRGHPSISPRVRPRMTAVEAVRRRLPNPNPQSASAPPVIATDRRPRRTVPRTGDSRARRRGRSPHGPPPSTASHRSTTAAPGPARPPRVPRRNPRRPRSPARTPTASAPTSSCPPASALPGRGWRLALYKATFGLVNLGPVTRGAAHRRTRGEDPRPVARPFQGRRDGQGRRRQDDGVGQHRIGVRRTAPGRPRGRHRRRHRVRQARQPRRPEGAGLVLGAGRRSAPRDVRRRPQPGRQQRRRAVRAGR